MTPFVDGLLAAPLGVTLLPELERAARPDPPPLDRMADTDADAVERAAAGIARRAVRDHVRRHLVPDWASVATEVDGVHLSWAGVLTAEGCVTDLGDGDVAMLRYWKGERTHWLNDVLGEPVPLGPPPVEHPVDVRTDVRRATQDLDVIRVRLNRGR